MAREGGKHLHQNRRGLEDLVGGWTNFWERRVPNTFSTNRWFQVEIPAIWKELLLQNGFIFPKYRGWNFVANHHGTRCQKNRDVKGLSVRKLSRTRRIPTWPYRKPTRRMPTESYPWWIMRSLKVGPEGWQKVGGSKAFEQLFKTSDMTWTIELVVGLKKGILSSWLMKQSPHG